MTKFSPSEYEALPESRATVSGAFRSVDRSWRRRVGELNDRRGDPAPGVRAVVIAVSRELLGARGALLERFVSVALQHQGGGTPDIDLGYHAGKSHACGRDTFNTHNCMGCEAACQGGDRWQRY